MDFSMSHSLWSIDCAGQMRMIGSKVADVENPRYCVEIHEIRPKVADLIKVVDLYEIGRSI